MKLCRKELLSWIQSAKKFCSKANLAIYLPLDFRPWYAPERIYAPIKLIYWPQGANFMRIFSVLCPTMKAISVGISHARVYLRPTNTERTTHTTKRRRPQGKERKQQAAAFCIRRILGSVPCQPASSQLVCYYQNLGCESMWYMTALPLCCFFYIPTAAASTLWTNAYAIRRLLFSLNSQEMYAHVK